MNIRLLICCVKVLRNSGQHIGEKYYRMLLGRTKKEWLEGKKVFIPLSTWKDPVIFVENSDKP